MSIALETVKIKKGSAFVIINAEDFNPETDQLFEEKVAASKEEAKTDDDADTKKAKAK